MRYYILIFSSLLIIVFIACKKEFEKTEISKQWSEYSSWLSLNGKVFSNGVIEFSSNSFNSKGNLAWELGIKSEKNGIEFFTVPFTFNNSFSKRKKILNNFDGSASLNHIVFWKDKKGVINARWRSRAYYIDNGIRSRKMLESYYTLEGIIQSVRLWSSTEKPIVGILSLSGSLKSNGKVAGCSQPFAVVTHSVSCTGTTMNNTVCTFNNITTYYIFCIDGEGVPQAEPESLEPAGDGWYEFFSETEEFENQNIIDSLGDSLNCAKDILKQLPNINTKANQILDSVFGVSPNVNITFRDADMGNELFGHTDPPNISGGRFNITVYLNRNMLMYASQEFIVKTMIHEAVHSYLYYVTALYHYGAMDSLTFKANYPKVWEYNFMGQAHHEEIVANFFWHITSVIHSYNPSLPDSVVNAIASSGLWKTKGWYDLGSDTFRQIRLQDTACYGSPSSKTALGLKICP